MNPVSRKAKRLVTARTGESSSPLCGKIQVLTRVTSPRQLPTNCDYVGGFVRSTNIRLIHRRFSCADRFASRSIGPPGRKRSALDRSFHIRGLGHIQPGCVPSSSHPRLRLGAGSGHYFINLVRVTVRAPDLFCRIGKENRDWRDWQASGPLIYVKTACLEPFSSRPPACNASIRDDGPAHQFHQY